MKNNIRKKKRKWKVFLFFLILLLLFLLFMGYLLFLVEQIPRTPIGNELEQVDLPNNRKNIAIFGLDGEEDGNRTDSIMVMSIHRWSGETKVVSILRDTLVRHIEGNYSKANAAYAWGGPEEAVRMLNRNLDLNISSYITVNYNSLATMVDVLGGLELDLTTEEINEMNNHIQNTAESIGLDTWELLDPASPGKTHVNGYQAVTYTRIRKGVGDDFARAERQREVLQMVISKSMRSGPITLNRLANAVAPTIKTNMTSWDIAQFGVGILRMNSAETQQYPFDLTTGDVSGLSGSFVIPINVVENVRQLHEFLYGNLDYQPTSTVQQISADITSKTGL